MTIATFIIFTVLVAVLTWWFTRGKASETDEGFFLAGRSLTWYFIAGSLLLTNLSTEQIVGLNAGAFKEGLSVMAWEVIAGMSMVILALFFLPRYLKSGIATIPQFLEDRYDRNVRVLTTMIFVVAYCLILLPFVLFLGAKGLNSMLDLETMFGLTEYQTIWAIVIFISVVGSAYAIFGGLKAVAVSDTFNGVGLLIGGLMITYFSLSYISGEGVGFLDALGKIKDQDEKVFLSWGHEGEELYWPNLFTGVLLLNFFYWCTNQQIIQRTFAAKSLAEGQKGVLAASFLKILAPIILVLPGIIAAYVASTDDSFRSQLIPLGGTDPDAGNAYGVLVQKVLPEPLVGFFAAVIVGSILSTFNSVLNSSATMFSLDIYKKILKPNATMKQVVWSGRIASFVVAVFATIAAPIIFYGNDSLFNAFQSLNGIYFIPLLAIFMVAFFNRWASGTSAVITALIGLPLMILGTFFGDGWLTKYFGSGFHYMGAVFVFLVVLQLTLSGFGMRRSEAYVQEDAKAVDLTPWKPAPVVGAILILSVLALYFVFAW